LAVVYCNYFNLGDIFADFQLSSPLISAASAEIIKPFGEWLCNYCAMGE
jgi:hypothetical protein